MIVSWNWLTDYLRLDMPVDTLTTRLALTGLNHESTTEVGPPHESDLAIDLEVTSNRPDCLGHLGVAREIAVVFGMPPLAIRTPHPPTCGPAVETLAQVRIDAPHLCPRFTARLITGVTVRESPWWLRKRLETLGVRPINNIVDITNYVMFERGQPVHAYDFDRLSGRCLIARPALPGESLVAINQKTYKLTPDMLVIADAARPVGLGGVMGGLETEIQAGTQTVLLEAALFDPISIRRTSRALGLFSPSSYRFERPIDPSGTDWSSQRAAELILELAGGQLHPGVLDVGTTPPPLPSVTLRYDQIARILGIAIPADRARALLEALGLTYQGNGNSHGNGDRDGDEQTKGTFLIPSWRPDLEREIDLIEEVARIHGYEHIPEDRAVPLTNSARGPRERVEAATREVLLGAGYDEAYTYSLVPETLVVPLEPPGAELAPFLKVDHSSRKVETVLRPSLIPSLLAARRHNESHGLLDADLFEIAHVYLPRPGQALPDEPPRVALIAGRDFFEVKGLVEALLSRLGIVKPLTAQPVQHPLFTPGRAARLLLGDQHLGYAGEVSALVRDRVDLRKPCIAAECDLQRLIDNAVLIPQAAKLSPYPPITRDLSLVVARSLAWSQLADTVRTAAGPLLEQLAYLDTFQGGNLPNDRQSVHFGMTFRHAERTLHSEEVDQAIQNVLTACANALQATLRA